MNDTFRTALNLSNAIVMACLTYRLIDVMPWILVFTIPAHIFSVSEVAKQITKK